MTGKTPFDTVLVANRGEIACRIVRAVQAAGMQAVAVYSDADAGAPHVALADRALCIGPGPATESYLSVERLLDAARKAGAGAVHPGYGFLSENAKFARACTDAGLVFIGPPPDAIALMGDKAAARARMLAAGLPCLPGYEGADQSDAALAGAAAKIGFPVMIKAAAGGGGRGMRLVRTAGEFPDALRAARDEARAAFGTDRMVLEKALEGPRHVEVQVVADRHGGVVHLGDRDCSVQRRHQKLIEEAPAPGLAEATRAAMGEAAVQVAQEIGYEGAGTVEFLLGSEDEFFFLEMNTRLQVEHPVTEMVTGRDLVALQLSVAQGEQLGFNQEDVSFSGHAIEARLCAEDPGAGFLPSSGPVIRWSPPGGPGIRVDDGIATGGAVPPYYDPLVAKIVAHGRTREEARERLIAALRDTVLFGPACNRDFLLALLTQADFVNGRMTTALVQDLTDGGNFTASAPTVADIALAAGLWYRARQAEFAASAPWLDADLLGWSSAGELRTALWLEGPESLCKAELLERGGVLRVGLGKDWFDVSGSGEYTRIGGQHADLRAAAVTGGRVHVATGARQFALQVRGQPRDMNISARKEATGGDGTLRAPMHGVLVRFCVAPGDQVNPGDLMGVIEAMKMQHELLAEVAGVVTRILVPERAQVAAGACLIETSPENVA